MEFGGTRDKKNRLFCEDGSEEEEGGLMDSNCIQYRVQGGPNETTVPGTAVPLRIISDGGDPNTSQSSTMTANVQAVLASPLNGQFYVIGSPQEVLGQVGQRSIAPRTYSLDNNPQIASKEERQGNRRATHNEVERRRRDNINHWIMKLGKLIPNEMGAVQDTSQGGKHAQSKGGILAKACEYVSEVRQNNERLRTSVAATEELTVENERLSAEIQRLQRENELLREQLNSPDPPSILKPEMDFSL